MKKYQYTVKDYFLITVAWILEFSLVSALAVLPFAVLHGAGVL